MPLHKALFIEPNPAGAKYALSRLGKMEATVRSPMVDLEPATAGAHRRGHAPCGLDQLGRDAQLKHYGTKKEHKGQDHRGEPQGAVFLRGRGHARGRLVLTGTEVKSIARGQGQHPGILRLGRGWRDLANQFLRARIFRAATVQP